ncbi:MAG: bleomycin resistance protein [Mucilaginibacter sp.]|nr:bleomycin resistance protein [Mucilaginibacter sp.]
MKNHIGRMIILVNDYEEASNFYEKNFGFKRIYDVTTDVGQRFLQIGTDEPNSTGLWFIKADGKHQRDNVGKQTNGQPAMVIYTSSFDDLYQQIKGNNVIINVAPVNTPDYKYFHCLDLYGNEIIIVELKAS